MICKKCRNNYKIIKPKHILLHNNISCGYCNDFSKSVDIIRLHSKVEYESDLTNWLYLNSPVIDGDKLIIANSRDFNIPFCDGSMLISEIILRQGMENNRYQTNCEKYKVINAILGFLYDDLYDKVRLNPIGVLLALLNCMEYNRFVAFSIISWLKVKDKEQRVHDDGFVNMVIDTFDMLNRFREFNIKRYNVNLDINVLYFNLETLLAADKLSLEHGIEVIFDRCSKDINPLITNEEVRFVEILNLLRAIHMAHTIKVIYTEGEKKECPLVFNACGKIIHNIVYDNLEDAYIYDMKNQRSFFSIEKYSEKIEKVVKGHFGFGFDSIEKIFDNIFKKYPLGDDFMVGDKESWCKVLEQLGELNNLTAQLLFQYFLFDINNLNIFDGKSRKNERITRKPIVMIDNVAICTVNSFAHALIAFKVDIYEGDIEDNILLNNLNKLYKEIDLEFEKAVLDFLKPAFSDASIKGDLREADLMKFMDLSDFPGQIDIIMLYGSKIFVIECKNFTLKTDVKSMANEYSRLTKVNSKSIQGKLNKKVTWVRNNIDKIINYFGDNYDRSKKYDVTGVITTSTFSAVSMEDKLEYPVITWTRLHDWIKQQLEIK